MWATFDVSHCYIIRIDRGKADEVRALVYRPNDCGPEEWKDIKFMIFDCPPSIHFH